MPEPQRGATMQILIAVAREAQVPPAMLTTHLPQAEARRYTPIRQEVIRRVLAEVPGVSVHMLARAFRRDRKEIREAVKGGNA